MNSGQRHISSRFRRVGLTGALFGLLCALFAGCNTPNLIPSATPTPTATETRVVTLTPSATPRPTATPLPAYLSVKLEDLAGLELRVWHGFRDETQAYFETLVEVFNDENEFGIVVNAESAISDVNLNERVMSVTDVEDHPNLIFSSDDYLRSWQREAVLFTPLDDYFDHPQYGIGSETRAALDARFPLDGKRTRFPLWLNPFFLFYNDTWGRQLGFSAPPETFGAFEEQICAARAARMNDGDPDNDGTGGWILSSAPGTVISWLSALNDTDPDFSDLTTAAVGANFIETVATLRRLFDEGCVWQSRLREPYAYFAGHNALVYSGTAADISFQRLAFRDHETNGSDDWRVIPYPGSKRARSEVYAETAAVGIVVHSADEQFASWLFLEWLLSGGRWEGWTAAAHGFPILDSETFLRAERKNIDQKIAAALYEGLNPVSYSFPADWVTLKPVVADGFAFAFGAGATAESAPIIWDQVLQTIEEINLLGF